MALIHIGEWLIINVDESSVEQVLFTKGIVVKRPGPTTSSIDVPTWATTSEFGFGMVFHFVGPWGSSLLAQDMSSPNGSDIMERSMGIPARISLKKMEENHRHWGNNDFEIIIATGNHL